MTRPTKSKAPTGRKTPAQGKAQRTAALGPPPPQKPSPEGAGQLPVGWVNAAIENIISADGVFVDGDWVESKDQDPNGEVRLIQLADVGDGVFRNKSSRFLTREKAAKLRCTFLKKGDLLIARMPDPLGRACVFPLEGNERFVTVVDVCIIRTSGKFVSPEFLRSAINFLGTRKQIDDLQTGTTRKRISRTNLATVPIPLPPLAEQRRIVAKIEELFSELDAGEESLRRARRQLGVYRQSLLKQAFEGKLTEQWREQNPQLLESLVADKDLPTDELERFSELPACWRYKRLGRFIRNIDAGKSFRCEERRPNSNEIGVAKVSAVTWGEYDEAESKTCIDPTKVNPGYFIRDGDFLLSRANTIELVGACVIVRRVTQPIMLSDKTLRLSIDDERKSFLLQYLRSHQGRREIENRSTGNQESMRNIGQERIRSIVVPECSLPEQREIVRLLDEQFTVIEQNEREIDAALKRSAALRQSILKKAFTGQLVPQDPTDEPAKELLARIRKEREEPSAVTKKNPKKTARKRTVKL